jgi:predicted Zn finger-like uncharacterized protein
VLTQCPTCQTVFRVTSTILRAAHGQVRCGRCNTQFDAIEHLFDGEDPTTKKDSGTEVTESPSGEYESTQLSHEEIVLEGNRIEISGVYRRPDVGTEDEAETHSHTVIEEFNMDSEEWENAITAADDAGPNDDADSVETELEDVEQELSAVELADAMAALDNAALPEQPTDDNTAKTAPADTAHNEPIKRTQSLPENSAVTAAHDASVAMLLDDELFADALPPRRWPWLIASAALSLLLITQAVNHARAALARHPSIGPQLSKLYAAIGQPLEPQWQLQAYSIKQWGIVSNPQEPGTLRVRASVTNGANFAQPYPLLHLSLEDRFGGQVGMRDFNPDEYLSSQTLATRLLGAGEAANIDLAIVDPGQEAVGFQFDTCLQLSGHLQCTHDLPQQ